MLCNDCMEKEGWCRSRDLNSGRIDYESTDPAGITWDFLTFSDSSASVISTGEKPQRWPRRRNELDLEHSSRACDLYLSGE